MNTNIANIIFQHFDRNILDNIYVVKRREKEFEKQFYICAYNENELYKKLWNVMSKNERAYFLLYLDLISIDDSTYGFVAEEDIFTDFRYFGSANFDEYDGAEILKKYFTEWGNKGVVIEKINIH